MECNGCTLCCLVADVPILNKPSGVQCKHCNSGCGIHDERPALCRDYWCVYQREDLPDELHPNNCHILFEKLDGSSTYVGTVDPEYLNSWVSKDVDKFVDEKVKMGISVVIVGDRKYIKSPDNTNQKDVINDLARAYGKWQSLHTQQI